MHQHINNGGTKGEEKEQGVQKQSKNDGENVVNKMKDINLQIQEDK